MNYGVSGNPAHSRVMPVPQQPTQAQQYLPRTVVPRPPLSHMGPGPNPSNSMQNVMKPIDAQISSGPPRKINSRSMDLLDQLRGEIEMLTAEISNCRAEKGEYEQKFRQQLTEIEHLHIAVEKLKEQHMQLKVRYDEDILRRGDQRQSGIQLGGARSSIPSPLLAANGGPNRTPLGSRPVGLVPLEQIKDGEGRIWSLQEMPSAGKLPGSVPPSNKRLRSRSPDTYGYPLASLDSRKNSSDNLMGGIDPNIPRDQHGYHDQQFRYRLQPLQSPNDPPIGSVHNARSSQDRFLPPAIAHNPHRLAPPHPEMYQQLGMTRSTADPEPKPVPLGPILPMPSYRQSQSQKKRTPNGEVGSQKLPSPSFQRGQLEATSHNQTRSSGDHHRSGIHSADVNCSPSGIEKNIDYSQNPQSPQAHFQIPNWSLEYANGGNVRRPAVELASCLPLGSVVCCVRFSLDGTKVATGSYACVKVFEVSTGKEIFEHKKIVLQDDSEADPFVRATCMSPDGNRVVAVMENNTARILTLADNGCKPVNLIGHQSDVHSLDWVRDIIASGSADCQVRLWDENTGVCRMVLGDPDTSPTDGVTCVALRPDGKLVAAASIDTTIHLWLTSDGSLIYKLDKYSKSVYSVAFSVDGSQLISGGLDETTKVWDIGKGTTFPATPPTPSVLSGHSNYVLSVCCTYDGRYIVSGSVDNTVIMWDINMKKPAVILRGFQNSIIGVGACPNQRLFATGGGDKILCLWRYTEAEDREDVPQGSRRINGMSKSVPSRLLPDERRSSEDNIDANSKSRSGSSNHEADLQNPKLNSISAQNASTRRRRDISSSTKSYPEKSKTAASMKEEDSDNSEYGCSERSEDSEQSN